MYSKYLKKNIQNNLFYLFNFGKIKAVFASFENRKLNWRINCKIVFQDQNGNNIYLIFIFTFPCSDFIIEPKIKTNILNNIF